MGHFRKYIRRLENKKTLLEVGTLVTLKHKNWEDNVIYGEIKRITPTTIICGISDSTFNFKHTRGTRFVGSYTVFTNFEKYAENTSLKLFLTETGEELSEGML